MNSRAWGLSGALGLLLVGLSITPVGAQHTFDGNLFWDNTPRWCYIDNSLPWDAYDLGAVYFTHNDTLANPQLGDPYNLEHPNWVPAWGSPALGAFDDVADFNPAPPDTCFDNWHGQCDLPTLNPVCYRGALPPARWGEDWTTGWTYYLNDGYDHEAGQPRQDIDYDKTIQPLSGAQTSDVHLTADYNYLVSGRFSMQAGTTLTIDPGVVVFGDYSLVSYIVIERGAQIHAVGTRQQPIIMTSAKYPGEMAPGDWAGLVINGRAVANCAACWDGESCQMEGGPGVYCGTEDCDNSGIMRYVRVEYAGYELAPANELNAFTFNGCGVLTDFAYLQAHRGDDDNFEWFGGKCYMHHLVATGGWDDNLDWQMGFRGAIQFEVAQQWPDGGDKAIEADNNEHDFNTACRSNPIIANCTFIGGGPTGTGTYGIHLRRGTDAQIYNCILMHWRQAGLRLQDAATVARGVYGDPGVFCSPTAVDEPGRQPAALAARVSSPVGPGARLLLQLPSAGRAQVRLFDAAGRLVQTALDAPLTAGSHDVPLNLTGAGSGAFFYRVETPDGVASGRFLVVE